MLREINQDLFKKLGDSLEGECHIDELTRVLYATDASVYRERPIAVCIPKSEKDLELIILFASENKLSIIPRAAGTSLAGQCVGNGIVVDISKHFTKIIEFNKEESWVRVQPGVVRDQLNNYLREHGFFFSPITSTANRATIGGMVGNNSCGTTSIVYGSTRDHVQELKTILSDGSRASFSFVDKEMLEKKKELQNLEGSIYRALDEKLSDSIIQENILKEFPKSSIHRRNTGYAMDILLASEPYSETSEKYNLSKLLCGSEGTLAFTTEIKLHVDPLPDPDVVIVAAHFHTLMESLYATQIAMKHKPSACELMDKIILDCTLENRDQRKNRFFVEGDPAAILTVEFRSNTRGETLLKANQFISDLTKNNMGYSFPIIEGIETLKVWKLRSAGLGLLANIPGDKKAVACIEDTAVDLEDLPEYIEEFTEIMQSFGQESVYYAHAGAGELHLRPILNLKDKQDVQAFYDISLASAKLVKKYNGSLSGEHGDGRLRAGFIPLMVGEKNYSLFREVKKIWDPQNIFNPGKIVNALPMNSSLRYVPDREEPMVSTIMNFDDTEGILRAAEKCNGSGDCRKSHLSSGGMCPSYQATKNEKDTTRARANALREFLSENSNKNPFDQSALKEVMDLCLSCKACKSECPSNIDMASMKAEFQHQYFKSNGIPFRARAFSHINQINRIASAAPAVFNFILKNKTLSTISKKVLGVSPYRTLPSIHSQSLRKWYNRNYAKIKSSKPKQNIYLFCDEFTNFNDTPIGINCIELLAKLNYNVKLVKHHESGRAAISKGLLLKAKKHANFNVKTFSKLINEDTPLIGIEPSAILSFRDEYVRLVDALLADKAKQIANNCFTVEEFLAAEIGKGRINSSMFHTETRHIAYHGHCHQKALSDVENTMWILNLPENYSAENIPSGCCGMAGSFGYEKEHYEISQNIGGLVLFPTIEKFDKETIISASGTSCRHQISDKFGKKPLHPVEILNNAIIK